MSTVVKDLGAATAYGYAVEKGYTGTEAEFAELMASYATVGQTAVDAKDAAVAAKTAAQTAATTATTKASEATTAATTATTKAGEASTSASTATSAKDTAVSASQTATTKAGEATTAAATAVSAKDDAVSANTAAQSAKTAAQTAQTGAETAAASVSASAAQIATNAEDISQLKSDLTTAENAIESLESGSLSAVSAELGDVPVAKGDGTWEWLNDGYVTPQMFGAKGDGEADDTAAFQALSGKTAFIPAGTYIISHVEYARKTTLFGAGMGKTIIKQAKNETRDLIDFTDADCSGMSDMTLLGNKSETSSDIYRALLKIRVSRTSQTNYSHYCNFEHLVIRNAPSSGMVLLGHGSSDPTYPNANHNWVHHFNDLRIEECNSWCLIDETSDNLFSNIYLNEGDLGNLLCRGASSNMYVNIKADQPYGGGHAGTLAGYNDGALVLLRNSENLRFVNIDLQSAAYVGAKIYNCGAIHFDGDINNCGLDANGAGIGLKISGSNHCTFNLEFHDVNTTPAYNVYIEGYSTNIVVYKNQRNTASDYIQSASSVSCCIIDQTSMTPFYGTNLTIPQLGIVNKFANPLCDALTGWSISGNPDISIDTSGKTTGLNSFKIVGDSAKSSYLYQKFTNLNPGDYYMALVVVNTEQVSSSASATPYLSMVTTTENNTPIDSTVYTNHSKAKHETGTELLCQVGRIDSKGDLEFRLRFYFDNGIYYVGNFMLFNLDDLCLGVPQAVSVYTDLYTAFNDIKSADFSNYQSSKRNVDYSGIGGIVKKLMSALVE